MDIIKKKKVWIIGVITFLFIMYVFPNFVNLNTSKSYLENKIEEIIGFKTEIKGDVSFTILPRPSLILRNVEISSFDENKKNSVFINAPQIFINTSIFNLFKKNLVINKIGMINSIFHADTYKKSGYENLDNLLNGKMFKHITIKNSRLVFKDTFIYQINMDFSSQKDNKLKGFGSFSYENSKVDDLSLLVSYLNNKNYNIVSKFVLKNSNNEFKNDITYIVNEGEVTFSDIIELDTDNLYDFLKNILKRNDVPDAKILKDEFLIKAHIQNSKDAFLVNQGSFEGEEIIGNFKGKIPFLLNEKLYILKDKINFDFNFINLPFDKVLSIKNNVFLNPIDALKNEIKFLSLLQYSNLNITIKNMVSKKGMINNVELITSPLFTENQFDGIDIKKMNFNIGKKSMNLVGKILNIPNDITLDIKVNTDIINSIPNIFTNKLILNKFNADVFMNQNSLNITNLKTQINNNDIEGSFSYTINGDNKKQYIANLKSEIIDLDKIINKKIDLNFIISKLSQLKSSNFILNAMVKSLKSNKIKYDLFKLNTQFIDGNLKIKNLSFNSEGYQSKISGNLLNILSSNGEFNNFIYNISSDNLKGLILPFVQNSFIEKMIANGVNKLDIKLNGPANNPMSEIDAILNKIKIKVQGNLLNVSSDYIIELYHDELKGFLFSWGYINDNLMNYFYDNLPFFVKATIQGNDIKDIELKIKDNVLKGEILRKKTKNDFETSVFFNTDLFDIKGIIKRIKETEGYIDLILKIIRGIPYNLTLDFNTFEEYDGNLYNDFYLNLQNAKNPGKFNFKMKKGNYNIDLSSEILNSDIFEGKINILNYSIPANIMQNELLNLVSGNLDATIDFKTNGTTSYQLLSNLSGDYKTIIKNGIINGISNYETILANILNLANITTNNVVYTIENSLKSGKLNFDTLSINGKINEANIENSAFKLSATNIIITGVLFGNLIQKSLNIESVFDIRNLSPESFVFIYNLKGFVNNLKGNIDTTSIISKINTVYLQKKKREILQ